MKNFWKILAALMVVALPFVVASCGDDDEDNGPKTYEYSWTLQNTTPSSSATTQDKQAALTAETAINSLLAAEFRKQGFTVDATNQKFSVQSENEPASFDNKVKSAVYSVKAQDAYLAAAEKLPSASKLVVKRGSTNIINESLK
ncbi:MAG: hypothetical protein IJK15_03840 [Bacteroidaceae bacterium]|nr:hypothetical protein [Bacteroidaceae bacterium]